MVYRRGGDYVTGQRCGIGDIRVTAIRWTVSRQSSVT